MQDRLLILELESSTPTVRSYGTSGAYPPDWNSPWGDNDSKRNVIAWRQHCPPYLQDETSYITQLEASAYRVSLMWGVRGSWETSPPVTSQSRASITLSSQTTAAGRAAFAVCSHVCCSLQSAHMTPIRLVTHIHPCVIGDGCIYAALNPSPAWYASHSS